MSQEKEPRKRLAPPQQVCEDRCVWVPHRDRLSFTVCAVCGKETASNGAASYNETRRVYRSALGLTSLMVRMHAKSRARILNLCQKFRIQSNTPNIHVTLAEGLDSGEAIAPGDREHLKEDIVNSFWTNNQVRVEGFQCIPTARSKHNHLVVLEVKLCGPIQGTGLLDRARARARLPQYPLHCAVGITSKTNAIHLRSSASFSTQCQQLELYINPNSLQELAPARKPGNSKDGRRMMRALKASEKS